MQRALTINVITVRIRHTSYATRGCPLLVEQAFSHERRVKNGQLIVNYRDRFTRVEIAFAESKRVGQDLECRIPELHTSFKFNWFLPELKGMKSSQSWRLL